jgi:HEPN domain-containing protein
VLSRSAGRRKGNQGSPDLAEIQFPYVHDLAALLTLLEKATGDLPDSIRQAERLTQFAVETRYPGTAAPVREKKYREAVRLAGEVLRWAQKQLRSTQR